MDTYPGCMSYGRKEGVALRRLGWLWWVKGRRLSEVGYRKGKERKSTVHDSHWLWHSADRQFHDRSLFCSWLRFCLSRCISKQGA